MKTISLHQPYATLMAIGAKQFETRHWTTPYRGRIAIHASKSDDDKVMCHMIPFKAVLASAGYASWEDLPRGGVVAIADFTHIFKTELLKAKLSEQEQAFGNYAGGRFAWWFQNVTPIDFVPLKGQQGLFNWDVPAEL